MQNSSQNNKRIAKNTLLLYFRMLFIMVISLFTSRVNLQSLGVEDYGIYNVVGGVVAMFSVFSGSLAAAISRFITYELGKNDEKRIQKVFSTSVTIQIGLAVIIIIIAEVVGVWFLNNKMVIPPSRIFAANWVLQLSILAFAINLISVPYNAAIIAHEKMSAFAYISIYEVIMKLAICYSLFVSPVDKLITFAILLFLLSLSLRLIYGIYCKRKFKECTYRFFIDKNLIKQIAGFAGWSSFTLVAYSLYTSGLNILLNLFFGPTVNAARAIAVQVQNAIQGFSKNFQIALNPQIIKSYADNKIQRVYSLIYAGTKFSFFLMFLIALPLFLETNYILSIWLHEVPEHTSSFLRLLLIIITIDTIGGPLYCAQQATGNIKIFQIVTGTLMLMILPVSYLFLKIGGEPEVIYFVYVFILMIVQTISVLLINRIIKMPLLIYAKEVALRLLGVVIISPVFPYIIYKSLPQDFVSFVEICVVCTLSVCTSIYFIGLTKREKSKIKNIIYSRLKK